MPHSGIFAARVAGVTATESRVAVRPDADWSRKALLLLENCRLLQKRCDPAVRVKNADSSLVRCNIFR
ncbi:MAG TPA: hypothetical protein VFS06_12670 [Casimicrobiaceae bacterium]|nr:hypothetical protein [Casimicrobiaceae bacterium]